MQALDSVLYELFGRQSNISGILRGALQLHWSENASPLFTGAEDHMVLCALQQAEIFLIHGRARTGPWCAFETQGCSSQIVPAF